MYELDHIISFNIMALVADSDRKDYYSFYYNLADRFWPGDYDHGNHEAEELVRNELKSRGYGPLLQSRSTSKWAEWRVPGGMFQFDSESGGFCIFSSKRQPLEFVVSVIEEMIAARPVEVKHEDELTQLRNENERLRRLIENAHNILDKAYES